MRLIFNLSIAILLLSGGLLSAQDSFLKRIINNDAPSEFANYYLLEKNDEILTTIRVSANYHSIIDFDDTGDIAAIWNTSTPDFDLGHMGPSSLSINDSLRCYVCRVSTVDLSGLLWCVNTQQNTGFGKNLGTGQSKNQAILNNNDIICTHDVGVMQPAYIRWTGVSSLKNNSKGTNWSYAYRLDSIFSHNASYQPIKIENDLHGNVIILGSLRRLDSLNNATIDYYLVKLNSDGAVLDSKLIYESEGFAPQDLSATSDGIYLSGTIFQDSTINNYGGLTTLNGLVCKLDDNLNFIWAKEIIADNFSVLRTSISTTPLTTLFTIQTYGDFPIISGHINAEGDISNNHGYAFGRNNYVVSNPDRSLSVTFPIYTFLPGGTTMTEWFIGQSDTNGPFASCPQFSSCFIDQAFQLTLDSVKWTRIPTDTLENFNVVLQDGNFTTEPYCETPPYPTPAFHLPDTICQADCLTPDSLNNRLANHVEWRILGPGVDTLVADTSFNICFEQAGDYLIQQEVWALGCSEMNSHVLTVLSDDLAPPLGEDRTICEPELYLLEANSSRPLRAFLWQDSSSTPAYAVTESGLYTLEASDGFCSVRDSVQLTFLADATGGQVALSVPEDTVLCEAFFPYALVPSSPFAETFSLENQTATQFDLREAGLYTISAEVFGCTVQENFRITTDDCRAAIYLPNAFSPNDDGVNDLLSPQGKDFLGLELQVFDRWGNQLLARDTPPFAWDGKAAGKAMPSGVYVIVFKYQNTRTGLEEQVSGEVTLVR